MLQGTEMAVGTRYAKPYWGNGHYYAFTPEGVTWSEAYDSSAASTLSQLGRTGYLATITSRDENDFITNYSYGTYTYGKSGSSPNYGAAQIPGYGFLAGTDDNGQRTSEGNWIWRGGPESGDVFRTNGSNTGYTRWTSGQPNNDGNQDFLRIDTAGYWDDADPNDSVSGYVTEWGRSGPQFTASFASLGSVDIKNGYESGPSAAPQLPTMTIKFDRFVPNDYVDIRNGAPLIDIPITFGGTAVLGIDYELEKIEGASYYSNGKIYARNTDSVTLTFRPLNNTSWQAPRTITASLAADGTENIYGLKSSSSSSSSKVWLFDDEPQLSLGQGAYKFIRTFYTSDTTNPLPASNSGFNTNADVLLFDSDGINELEEDSRALGLRDNFAIRWETYIRIPEKGSYVFRTTTEDGAKLTLKQLPDGIVVNGIAETTTGLSSGSIALEKGAVIWLQFDYIEDDSDDSSAKLTWDRPDGENGIVENEVIPASAMFLSEALARGVNLKESSSDDPTPLGFQLFANKKTDNPLDIKLSSTSETSNSTINKSLAQRQGSTAGGDYQLFTDAAGKVPVDSAQIGLDTPSDTPPKTTYGSLEWQPSKDFGTLENVLPFYIKALKDEYAENTEAVTLSLGSNNGSGSGSTSKSGYGIANGSQTIKIEDDSYVLSLSAGQNPTEGGGNESDLGWFTITSSKPVPKDKGLRVKYEISKDSKAERGSDYFAAQATLTTAAFKAEDLVVFPDGATKTRIYISAIADAIREGNDETIVLTLIPNEEGSPGFEYQRYNIVSNSSTATLTIIDGTAYQPAVVLTPADRTGRATVRAQLVNGQQQAEFDVHLSSQPLAAVSVNLSISSGSGTLSSQQLSFSSSNWTQPQRVTLTGLSTEVATTVIANCSSKDGQYNEKTSSQLLIPSGWATELELSLWEGGSLVPSQPLASVQAIDGTEGSNSRLGFELALASPVVGSPVELFYQLSGSEGFSLDGTTADAEHRPQASYRPLVLQNSSSGGGYAYADLGGLATVSSSGEISAEAWVRRDVVTTAAGLLEFTDSNGQNQIKLGFHEATGRPELEIRDGGGKLLLSLIADSEVALKEWVHLAYSVEASGVARLYLNGELAKQGTLAPVTGLKVGLYEGRNFETLRSTTAEATINFSDSFDTAKGGDGDTFSLRAAGQIQAKSNGENSFAVFADDGVKIWVNGTKVVDTWVVDPWDGPSGTWTSFTAANLVAGEWYDIQIDYNENSGLASLQLADKPNGAPITALRHVPLYTKTRGFNSIGRTALGSDGTGYLAGAVRGVGIWNAARSQDQIQASMLAASPGGSGLISGLSLNNSTANSVNGAPAAVLYSGSGNSAAFASTPFYGLQLPVGSSSVSLPIVPLDDLTAEGTEALTLTLIAAGRYSLGGTSTTATATFSDNEVAEILFLADGQTSSTTSDTSWTSSSQFRVGEQDVATNTSSALGIRLNSRPSSNVTLTLDAGCSDSTELTVTNPANPTAQPVSLMFTPDNWDQVQQLRLQGVDDSQDDGDTALSLSFTVSSSDALYAGLKPVVSVLAVDDDATRADPTLATEQSSSAPLARLSGPSQSTINEAGSDRAIFTISLAEPANEDTLVFLGVDQRLSQVGPSDIRIVAGSGSQSLAGLRRFDASAGGAETTRLDSDGINETATSFSANNLSGDFSSTWSGYLYIPETGSYNFIIPVRGDVRLSLDGQDVIKNLTEASDASDAERSTGTLQLTSGDFLAFTLDYQSFGIDEPSVALRWLRPSMSGTTSIDDSEIVPSQYLSLTDGFSLLIAKGSSSGTFTVQGAQDQVDENIENLAAGLLLARGVEIVVKGQSSGAVGSNQLQVALSTSDRESISLEAGTVLTLGEAKDPKSNKTQTEAIATFTLSDAATIHRDRTATLSGTLTSYGQSSPYSSSVVGLVAGQAGELYQLPDPSVSLTLVAPLSPNGTDGYLATLQLGDTNLGSVTIPADTALSYVVESTGAFLTLVLSNDLTLKSGQTASGIKVTVPTKSTGLDPTAAALQWLSSAYVLPNTSVVQLLDDDKAGLLFSLDASGSQPIDGSRFSLSEQGDSATRYVRLSSQPSESVTVYLETADASEARLQVPASNPAEAASRIALLFNPTNWQTAQAFTVLPADDHLYDGSINVDIVSRTTSADGFYAISTAGTLPFAVNDDDTPKVMVELQQSSISKAGNGFINLSLTAQPTADVSVNLVPEDGQFTLNDRSIGRGESLVFTPDNWSTVRSVALWAVDDSTSEDVTSSQLQLSTASSDVNFNELKIKPVRVDIIDNDPPQAQITLVSDSTEESRPGRFRIQLTNPAPDSAGSNGIEVNYLITAVSFDPGLDYPPDPADPANLSSISKLTQSPGAVSGHTRIAPGQTSSDVIVVPIDDYVEDKKNKSFTVQLVDGDGYTLSNDSASNSATVQIINNDVAGVMLFTSGDRILVKESGESATFQLSLLTQPTNPVTIRLSEQILDGGTAQQLGTRTIDPDTNETTFKPYSAEVTFTNQDWYVAKSIEVQAYDDYIIEDGSGDNQFTGIHGAQLKYNFSSLDKSYDSAGKNAEHFTNLVQAVDVLDVQLPTQTADALQSSLTSLQEGIDSLSLPIVGSLDGKAGDGLRKFITNLVNSVRQVGTPTPYKLSKLLSSEIAKALGIPEDTVKVVLGMQDTSAIVVSFQFADSYDIVSVPLAADFGLPGLGFQSQGSLDAEFNYDAALRLVFPRKGDIYLDTGKDPETKTANTYLSAKFITSLSDDFSLTGGLGFLQLDAVNKHSNNSNVNADTGLEVSFNLDLSGDVGSDGLTLNDLINPKLNLEKLFQYQLTGNAAMSFGVTTSINGSAAIPSFSFDLSSKLPLFDYSNQDKANEESSATSFYFDNIKLDLGTFITDMLSPIVDGLDRILNPLYPIVDALYSDTYIFDTIGLEKTFDSDSDGHVTAIDLASWFAGFYANANPKDPKADQLKEAIIATTDFLDLIKDVIDLVRDLKAMSEEGNFYVDYGEYVLPTFSAANPKAATKDVDVEKTTLNPDTGKTTLNPDTGKDADKGGKNKSNGASEKFKKIMAKLDTLGFEIPLIDDPKNAIKLLLGQNVDLFTWTMPKMGMSSEVEKSFPIYPGIEGIIEGGFGVEANLGFGFDTYGLNQWKKGGFKANDAWKVFDGFYVADGEKDPVTKKYVDVPEFSMDATMGAGLGLTALVVRSDITGGLEAAASFDLLDEGEVAGTSDGKIRGSEMSRITNPLDLFELVGSLSAYLKAEVQVGVDAGLFQTWDTVWQEKLAEIPLFEFGVGGSYGTGSVSNGYVQGATVYWDGNQNHSLDAYEPSTITGADAAYNLRIDHRSFDLNRNGKIDASDGHLVAFGGIDTSTGLALEVPFLAPLGQMVTPLTTLHTLAVANGYDDGAASSWINQAFNLQGFDYLKRDPVLELNQLAAGPSPAQLDPLAAYIGHIKLHFSWDVLVYSLQQLLSKQFPEESNTEFGLLNAFSQELLSLPADIAINDRLATAALRTSSRFKPDLTADDAPLAALAAGLAANASWDLFQQIDALFASASEKTTSLADSLVAINQLKRDAFEHYRTDTESISQGLYRISDPEELDRTAQQRLSAVYSSFIKDHPLQSASADPANGLLKLLDTKDWALSGVTTLTSTPFTTIQSFKQLGISLSNKQLDFGLRLQPSSDELSAVNQHENPRVLVSLDRLGLPQRTADAAFNFYVDTDQAPTSFLYDANNKTGARFFRLGSDLSPVVELSYRDDRRGDADPDPGVIQDPGAVAELVQVQQFKGTDQANVFSIGASNAADKRTAALFLSTDVVSLPSTSNQVGYMVLQDHEVWDPASITLGQLLERIQYIGGSLESSDLPTLGSTMKFQRELQFTTGDRFVFLEAVDCTLVDLGPRSASVASLGARILTLESRLVSSDAGLLLDSPKSGLKLQLKLQNAEPGLPAFLARQQSLAPVLDFTGLGGMSVTGTLQIAREAAYNSTLGFYKVLDVSGAVMDSLTGTILHPADAGYQQAALRRLNLLAPLADLSTANLRASSRELSITADGIFAPYAVVDTGNGSHTYFAFEAANPDQLQHFQMLGDNTFALEDLYGGGDRDFDDTVVSFQPIGVIPLAAS